MNYEFVPPFVLEMEVTVSYIFFAYPNVSHFPKNPSKNDAFEFHRGKCDVTVVI